MSGHVAIPDDSMRSIVAGQEEVSVFKFGESLRRAPNLINSMADTIAGWARIAREDQPIGEAVVEHMEAAANLIRSIASDSAGWYSEYRKSNETDIDRIETPRRGSLYIEAKADVAAAERDGL